MKFYLGVDSMLNKSENKRDQYEMISVSELVPKKSFIEKS